MKINLSKTEIKISSPKITDVESPFYNIEFYFTPEELIDIHEVLIQKATFIDCDKKAEKILKLVSNFTELIDDDFDWANIKDFYLCYDKLKKENFLLIEL